MTTAPDSPKPTQSEIDEFIELLRSEVNEKNVCRVRQAWRLVQKLLHMSQADRLLLNAGLEINEAGQSVALTCRLPADPRKQGAQVVLAVEDTRITAGA